MQIYLHQEYRQFRRMRTVGEIITVRDGIGAGLISRGAACPVMDGQHQCQVVGAASITESGYEDEMMESPADRVLLPVKWSHSKRQKIRAAGHRSKVVRSVIRGRRFEDIQVSELR